MIRHALMLVPRQFATALMATALMATPVSAQTPTGNASLSVTGSPARVALPAWSASAPFVLIAPGAASTQEVFYKIGDVTVTAATTDKAMPAGGICISTSSTQTHLSAITETSTATLRLTRFTVCPLFAH